MNIVTDAAGTERVEYGGRVRLVRGRLTYPAQPDPGQLVGPTLGGERLVILGPDPDGVRTLVGLAIVGDL